MNNSGPTAQIIERDSWKTELDFVGHRKAVTCVVSLETWSRVFTILVLKLMRLYFPTTALSSLDFQEEVEKEEQGKRIKF